MDLKRYTKKRTEIFITIWKDLGNGQSIQNAKYQSQVKHKKRECRDLVRYKQESTCTSFDKNSHWRKGGYSGFQFDSLLTPQDEKKLTVQV
jgi:hypothetical protein